MKIFVKLALIIFGSLFLLLLGTQFYEGEKYKKHVLNIRDCNSRIKILSVKFDDFNFGLKREFVYKDSDEIRKLMKYICVAKPRYISDRSGAIHECKMHIEFESEVATLILYKDERDFCTILYSPGVSQLLYLQSPDLVFVFYK